MGKHASLARRIKELRQAQGWTQQDLSRGSGLSRSYISRLEMGDIALPSSERLRALSTALGTTSNDLLQAAGFLDAQPEPADLPDIRAYLRRKYAIQDPHVLQAIETIVSSLRCPPSGATGNPSARDGIDTVTWDNQNGEAHV